MMMDVSLKRSQSKGVTLIEIIVVVIIIGILATMALPMFPKAMEATKAKEAVAALHQIRTGERIYRLEENTYWPSSGAGGKGEINGINGTLRLLLDVRDERNWDYTISAAKDIFTATATRISGGATYNGSTITINQVGTFGGNWPLPLPK